MPLDIYQSLKANKQGWTLLALGVAALAASSAVAIVATALRAPGAPAAPVIVEKQVVVPSNCLIFCGQ